MKFMSALGAIALLASLVASPFGVDAAQPEKLHRIGMLERTPAAANTANVAGFRQRLRELGYVEGESFVIDYRSADGHDERFPALAADLVRLKVDLIVTRGTPAALAVKGATARIAGLFNMGNPALPPQWKEVEKAARSRGLEPLLLDVRKAEDLEPAFETAVRQRANALVVGIETLTQANQRLIVELSARYRLPAMYASTEFTGGLISYGVNYPEMYRRAAVLADKIFKGAKPADIPVEEPTTFELAINLKTARTLGLTVPRALLLRADTLTEGP